MHEEVWTFPAQFPILEAVIERFLLVFVYCYRRLLQVRKYTVNVIGMNHWNEVSFLTGEYKK